jgi:flagellar hook-associated protein 3 FlgL
MRISTAALHSTAIDSLLNQQSALSKTQSQVASGKSIQSPADDPIGAVHVLELQRALSESGQYGRNADAATTRLSTEEQALSDAGGLLQRVRELVLSANNGTMDPTALNAVATEMSSRVQEMMDLANTRDGNGEFLFSGYATTTQPFARTGANVAYAGDQGTRLLQTGPTQRIADSHSGFDVFMNIPQGNGTFVTTTTATNTGTGSIDSGSVTNASAWVRDNYTITFLAPDTYEVRDAANNVEVAAVPGNYTSGNAISFNGVRAAISGAPATGDTFTLAASQKEDIFTTLDRIVTALRPGNNGVQTRAQFNTQMAGALDQLDQDEQHLLNVRSDIGSRLSTLDDSKATRDNFSLDLQSTLSNVQDLDYAEAISRMNRQMLGLEAAQKSYAQISHLSLFDYL